MGGVRGWCMARPVYWLGMLANKTLYALQDYNFQDYNFPTE